MSAGSNQVFFGMYVPKAWKELVEQGRRKMGMRSASDFCRTAIGEYLKQAGFSTEPSVTAPPDAPLFPDKDHPDPYADGPPLVQEPAAPVESSCQAVIVKPRTTRKSRIPASDVLRDKNGAVVDFMAEPKKGDSKKKVPSRPRRSVKKGKDGASND